MGYWALGKGSSDLNAVSFTSIVFTKQVWLVWWCLWIGWRQGQRREPGWEVTPTAAAPTPSPPLSPNSPRPQCHRPQITSREVQRKEMTGCPARGHRARVCTWGSTPPPAPPRAQQEIAVEGPVTTSELPGGSSGQSKTQSQQASCGNQYADSKIHVVGLPWWRSG